MSQEQHCPRCSAGRTGKGGQSLEDTAGQQLRDRREPQGQQDQNADPSVDNPEFDIPRLPLLYLMRTDRPPCRRLPAWFFLRSRIHHRPEGGNHGSHEHRTQRNNKPAADKEREKNRECRLAARGLVGMLKADEKDHQ